MFWLQVLGWVLIIVGVIGAILPMLPGPALVWVGAFLLAWADGFQAMGYGTLALLFVLALLAGVMQWIASALGARAQGASWLGVLFGFLGAVLGLILGNVPGLIVGAIGGVFLAEWLFRRKDWRDALKGSVAYVIGYFFGAVGQVLITLIMVAIIVSQTLL